MSDNKVQLIEFLKGVTEKLEEDLLTSTQTNSLVEFQTKYNENTVMVVQKPKFTEEDVKDMFKMLIVGCYIYRLANIYKTS